MNCKHFNAIQSTSAKKIKKPVRVTNAIKEIPESLDLISSQLHQTTHVLPNSGFYARTE